MFCVSRYGQSRIGDREHGMRTQTEITGSCYHASKYAYSFSSSDWRSLTHTRIQTWCRRFFLVHDCLMNSSSEPAACRTRTGGVSHRPFAIDDDHSSHSHHHRYSNYGHAYSIVVREKRWTHSRKGGLARIRWVRNGGSAGPEPGETRSHSMWLQTTAGCMSRPDACMLSSE